MSAPRRALQDLEDVKVARRYFYAGFAFLPLLWAVSLLHYRHRVTDPTAPPELVKYVRWTAWALAVATCVIACWVIIFQFTWESWGRSLLVVDTVPSW